MVFDLSHHSVQVLSGLIDLFNQDSRVVDTIVSSLGLHHLSLLSLPKRVLRLIVFESIALQKGSLLLILSVDLVQQLVVDSLDL